MSGDTSVPNRGVSDPDGHRAARSRRLVPGDAPPERVPAGPIRAGAGARVARAVTVLPDPGRRVWAYPSIAPTAVAPRRRRGPRAWRGPRPRRRSRARRWRPSRLRGCVRRGGTSDPVSGVSVRTAPVPAAWLRPPLASRPMDDATHRTRASSVPVHHPIGQRAPVPVPASTRIRRAAMMAFGLLVSLVAVEAAARVGRR